MYADLKDVNAFLPQDKLPLDSSELPRLSLDADRIIRGYVGGVFAMTEISTWADPAHTPELIRSIAGRLIAAAWYSERYAENSDVIPAYAQGLYNQAISYLAAIKAGTQVVIMLDGSTLETNALEFNESFFTPNKNTSPPAAFTRGMIFG